MFKEEKKKKEKEKKKVYTKIFKDRRIGRIGDIFFFYLLRGSVSCMVLLWIIH